MGWQEVRDLLLSVPVNPCRKTAKGNLASHFQHSDLCQVDAICTTCNIRGGNKNQQDVSRKAGKNASHFKALLLCSKVDILTKMSKNSRNSANISGIYFFLLLT